MFRKSTHFDLLIYLLQRKANYVPLRASTTEIAADLEVSQQTVSRWLIEMEQHGYIERKHEGIRILSPLMDQMAGLYHTLKEVYGAPRKLMLEGTLVSGVQDGKYYLSISEYKLQIKERLGFTPFPGTLNVKLDDAAAKSGLLYAPGVDLDGFFRDGQTLGSAKCFPCKINKKVKGAVVIPLRSHHGSDILELISASNLRKELHLKDGSRVKVEIDR